MKKNVLENSMYVIMALLILGQGFVGANYLFGQACFLIGNIFSVVRDFALKRPMADKVKNVFFTAFTIVLMYIYLH